jgi:hypothetical protein
MATFRKIIARPGTYLARNLSGERVAKTITTEDIKKIADSGNAMLAAGHLIPAPYGHTDKNGTYPLPLSESDESPSWDHAVNAGFWKEFSIGDNGELVGTLEVDGDQEDPNSHAGRVGKTFRQTSALLAEKWVDGSGTTFNNAPLHVCLTNKAVERDQSNFEPVDAQSALACAFALSMGDSVGGYEDNIPSSPEGPAESADAINKLKTELKSKLGISLPEDTNPTNFFDRLIAILTNLKPKEEEGDMFSEPKDSEELSAPSVMSNDIHKDDPKMAFLLNNLVSSKKDSYKSRINELVKEGKVGRKYADDTLLPKVDAFSLSLDDINEEGNSEKNYIELALETLEAKESLTESTDTQEPSGSEVPEEPVDMSDTDQEPTMEEVNERLNQFFPSTIYTQV